MLLSMFVGIKILYVSPAGLEMPSNIVEELKSQGFDQSSCVSLDEVSIDWYYLFTELILN